MISLLQRAAVRSSGHSIVRPRLLTSAANGGAPLPKRDTPITWPLLGIVIGVGGLSLGYYLREKDAARDRVIQSGTRSIGKPLLGGPFTLVNHEGQVATDRTLFPEGSRTFGLLYFGFTHCPDICPSEMVKMTKAIANLDELGGQFKDRMLPIFVSVDPKRDGVAQLSHYIKDFHPRTVGLTGTPAQVAAACKSFRVYHVPQQTQNEGDEYLVDHSIVIYLLAPNGEFLDFFTQLAETDEIVARIRSRIAEFDREHRVNDGD
jgi:protein SCO1/2